MITSPFNNPRASLAHFLPRTLAITAHMHGSEHEVVFRGTAFDETEHMTLIAARGCRIFKLTKNIVAADCVILDDLAEFRTEIINCIFRVLAEDNKGRPQPRSRKELRRMAKDIIYEWILVDDDRFHDALGYDFQTYLRRQTLRMLVTFNNIEASNSTENPFLFFN